MYGRGRLNLTSLGWKCVALAVDFSPLTSKVTVPNWPIVPLPSDLLNGSFDEDEASCHGTCTGSLNTLQAETVLTVQCHMYARDGESPQITK